MRVDAYSPPRRGGVARSAGVVGSARSKLCRSDHPVCATSVASRYFLIGAATPPLRGGEYVLEDLIDRLIESAARVLNILVLASRWRVRDCFCPIDAERRIHRGGDVFHADAALCRPSKIDDLRAVGIGRSNCLRSARAAAGHQ